MDTKPVAGVAGQPHSIYVNGCDKVPGQKDPSESPANPSDCRTLAAALEAPEHVYFIYSDGAVKIGYSSQWLVRTMRVIDSCPAGAELILVMPGSRRDEAAWHRLFADSRLHGEWFSYEPDLKRFLHRYASPTGREILESIDGENA